jgi:hypothetical protein
MSKTVEKAARAVRLRDNKAFQEFVNEVLEDQRSILMDAQSTPDAREQAHAIVRAISAISAKLKTAETDARFEQKKKRSAPR